MIALYIIGGIVLVLLFLATIVLLLPVKIVVEYKNNLRFSLRILGFCLWRSDQKKKVRISDFTKEAIEKRRLKAQKRKLRMQKTAEKTNRTKQENDGSDLLSDISQITKRVTKILSRGLKHIKIEVRRLIIAVATDEASKTAILFGSVNQACVALLELLNQTGKLKYTRRTRIKVYADFSAPMSEADINIIFSIRTWQILDVLFRAPIQYEKILLGDSSKDDYNLNTDNN